MLANDKEHCLNNNNRRRHFDITIKLVRVVYRTLWFCRRVLFAVVSVVVSVDKVQTCHFIHFMSGQTTTATYYCFHKCQVDGAPIAPSCYIILPFLPF